MHRYFLYLSYDGTRYHGWQIQPNGISVQQVVQNALSTILRTPVSVTAAGRTDAGVHALLMPAHFDVPSPIDSALLTDKLNRLLPPDVATLRILPVTPKAHARFDAISRTYHYYVHFHKSPFLHTHSLRLFKMLNFERMNQAAALIPQYSDFTSFSKVDTDTKTNICHIMRAVWIELHPDEWRFEIEADRFLRNMVRAIVGTLIEVGRERMTIQDFCNIIERRDRRIAGQSMPAHALFLVNVTYPAKCFEVSETS